MTGHSSPAPGSKPTSTSTLGQHNSDTKETHNEAEPSQIEAQNTPQELIGNEKGKLQDQTNLLPIKQLLIVFVGLSCALFCALIDQTIVSTALPTLGRVFNDASIESWVGTAYLLTSTACQPLYGRLSDIFGRKIVLLSSMGFFLIGSILSAVSTSMIMLIVFRAISGIGGGGILTSVMITVSDVVSLEKRGTYQGIIGVVVALSNSIGPLIGGLFTEKVTWRWCFYINIPLISISILVVLLVLPLKRVKGNVKARFKQVDYLGSITMIISAVLILVPISWGGTKYAWSSAGVIAPLVLGIVFFGLFILVELKFATLPLIPKTRPSPAITCGLLSTLSSNTSIVKVVGYQILSGVGSGQTLQTNLVTIQANVKRNEMAVATATQNFIRLLGGTIALSVCFTILNNTVRTSLSSIVSSTVLSKIISDPTRISSGVLDLTAAEKSAAIDAYTHGIRNIYYFMIASSCVSFFVTVFFVRGTSLKRDDDAKLQEEGKIWAAKHRGLHALGKKNVESTVKVGDSSDQK
ncbi:hypothetical protein N7528_000787 [Penicillium herquei]|nr:hypothetical protein N7528_000787 [Penicillium herquei]